MASAARVEVEMPHGGLGGANRRRTAITPAAARACDRSLSALIEREIIPRLMIAHAVDGPDLVRVTADEVDALAPLALQVHADALLAQVEAVMARGVPVAAVMVDLLAPTARLLGEWWEDDRVTFVDVTMGLWRLQQVVHEIAARAPLARQRAAGGRRALFAAMPGENHDFGTVVIDELFRGDGWVTQRPTGATGAELARLVGDGWFDLVGLTISCDCNIASLTPLIAALRNVSTNPRLCVMIGGRVIGGDMALAVRLGADGTAGDARQALQVAGDLVRTREGERLTL